MTTDDVDESVSLVGRLEAPVSSTGRMAAGINEQSGRSMTLVSLNSRSPVSPPFAVPVPSNAIVLLAGCLSFRTSRVIRLAALVSVNVGAVLRVSPAIRWAEFFSLAALLAMFISPTVRLAAPSG